MYLLLAFAYLQIALHIPPRIPFSNNNNIFSSVNSSNVCHVIFKPECQENAGADK